ILDPVDSLWKLAGINAGVDGFYSLTGGADTGFRAVLFDKGGLYVGTQNQWTPVAEGPNYVPSRFYATQVSAYQDWVQALIPEPRAYALVTGGLLIAEAIRRRARQ
ncbi:MAG: hypothetical protein KDM81_16110, partial [Verrucomicrobiae bacterium]|nr:hypothetical protein [Verrucomicrobiae bacterium]